MRVTPTYLLFFLNVLFTVILILWSVFECVYRAGLSNLLLLAVRNEPKALMLDSTISLQKPASSVVLHLPQFQDNRSRIVGCGEWGNEVLLEPVRYNFSLRHNFVIYSILSFLVTQKLFLKINTFQKILLATLMVIEQWSPLRSEKRAYTEHRPGDLLYDGAFQPLQDSL